MYNRQFECNGLLLVCVCLFVIVLVPAAEIWEDFYPQRPVGFASSWFLQYSGVPVDTPHQIDLQ